MASGHFLCLLVFIAFSISSLQLAFGARSLMEVSSEHDQQAADEQALFPFKKFLKPFFKHKFHHKHKLPFKHEFKFPPKIKFPPHDASVTTDGSLSATTKQDLDGVDMEVHDEKFLPKFKFPFKFFPKKKFPPKFKFPPRDASVANDESLSTTKQDSSEVVEGHDEKFLPKYKFPKFFFPKKKFPPKFKFPPLTEDTEKMSSTTVVPIDSAVEATTVKSSGSAMPLATTKTEAP
ncbi:hypothetical protein Droror1_Dr00001241 [Drosera rotundifolia]